MFSLFCLVASSAILFFILKYRVHVHVTLTSSRDSVHVSRGKGRRAEVDGKRARVSDRDSYSAIPITPTAMTRPVQSESEVMSHPATVTATPPRDLKAAGAVVRPIAPAATHPESVVWGDIASGLVNLGASKADARRAALKACKENPGAQFNSVFTAALQEVGRAA